MLSASTFDAAFLGELGQNLAWRQAATCPCFSHSSGAARPGCPICLSKGVYWTTRETFGRCGLSNQSQAKAFANFGEWSPGDALLTIPGASPFYGAGQYDRFRCLDSTERFSTNLDPEGANTLPWTVVEITSVTWTTPDGTALIQGSIPMVNPDGSLSFPGLSPPAGQGFAVNGVRYVEYFAYLSLPANRNIGTSGLPKKLPVRRLDLFKR